MGIRYIDNILGQRNEWDYIWEKEKRHLQFSHSKFYHSEIQKSGTERTSNNDTSRPRSRRKTEDIVLETQEKKIMRSHQLCQMLLEVE